MADLDSSRSAEEEGASFHVIATSDAEPEKTCTNCGKTKPIDEFYKDAQGAFGRKGQCIECLRPINAARKRIAYKAPKLDMVQQALENAAYRLLKEILEGK